MSPCAHLFCALQTSITAASIVFQVCLPKIADCHATICGDKHRNVAENENSVSISSQKTWNSSDKRLYLCIKIFERWKGSINRAKVCKRNANVLPPNMLMSSHSLIARLCIALKQLRMIGTGYFQQFLDLFVMRRRDTQTVTLSLKLFIW